jgi:hypothetical protein
LQQFGNPVVEAGDCAEAQVGGWSWLSTLTCTTTSVLLTVATSVSSCLAQSYSPLPRIHIFNLRHKARVKSTPECALPPGAPFDGDRPQLEVSFADFDASLGLWPSYVPASQLRGVFLGAVGAKQVGVVRELRPALASAFPVIARLQSRPWVVTLHGDFDEFLSARITLQAVANAVLN